MAGQRLKGVGVDCVQFVAAVLDELCQCGPTEVPRSPQDSGLHSQWEVAAGKSFAAVHRTHPLERIHIEDNGDLIVEAGDILVHRSGAKGGAGHVSLVSHRQPAQYHSICGSGVKRAVLPQPDDIMHAWRVKDKTRWEAAEKLWIRAGGKWPH